MGKRSLDIQAYRACSLTWPGMGDRAMMQIASDRWLHTGDNKYQTMLREGYSSRQIVQSMANDFVNAIQTGDTKTAFGMLSSMSYAGRVSGDYSHGDLAEKTLSRLRGHEQLTEKSGTQVPDEYQQLSKPVDASLGIARPAIPSIQRSSSRTPTEVPVTPTPTSSSTDPTSEPMSTAPSKKSPSAQSQPVIKRQEIPPTTTATPTEVPVTPTPTSSSTDPTSEPMSTAPSKKSPSAQSQPVIKRREIPPKLTPKKNTSSPQAYPSGDFGSRVRNSALGIATTKALSGTASHIAGSDLKIEKENLGTKEKTAGGAFISRTTETVNEVLDIGHRVHEDIVKGAKKLFSRSDSDDIPELKKFPRYQGGF